MQMLLALAAAPQEYVPDAFTSGTAIARFDMTSTTAWGWTCDRADGRGRER